MLEALLHLTLLAAAAPTSPAAPELRVVVAQAESDRGGLPALEWEVLTGFARLASIKAVRVPLPSGSGFAAAVTERAKLSVR
jgi:hypothetical protein